MNLFIIASPLQLFNALEAKEYFHLKSSECILIILDVLASSQQKNSAQIRFMLSENDFDKIFHITRFNYSWGWIHSNCQLNKLARLFDRVENIFIGECRTDLVRNFVHSLKYRRIYLLDDGNGTLRIYNYLNTHISKRQFKYETTRERIVSFIKSNIFKSNIAEIENLNYFTVYDIGKGESNVIKHHYQCFRERIHEKSVTNDIYFLGSDFSEQHIMHQEVYLNYIKRIKAYFGDSLLFYIPHRGESAEKIANIKKLGINIKNFNTCIEFELGRNDYLPGTIASFYSAALENCHVIFGPIVTIKSFSICPTDLDPKFCDNIQAVYSYYRHSLDVENFQVIDLGNH